MRNAPDRIAHAPAVASRRSGQDGWTWRHVLTVLLLALTLPVFLAAAAIAAVVVAPLAVVYGLAQALRLFRGGAIPARRLLLR